MRRVPEGHPARPAKEFDTSEFLLSKNERVKKFRAANNPRLCVQHLTGSGDCVVCGVGKILNRHNCCGVPDFALQDDISFHVFVPRHCEE